MLWLLITSRIAVIADRFSWSYRPSKVRGQCCRMYLSNSLSYLVGKMIFASFIWGPPCIFAVSILKFFLWLSMLIVWLLCLNAKDPYSRQRDLAVRLTIKNFRKFSKIDESSSWTLVVAQKKKTVGRLSMPLNIIRSHAMEFSSCCCSLLLILSSCSS